MNGLVVFVRTEAHGGGIPHGAFLAALLGALTSCILVRYCTVMVLHTVLHWYSTAHGTAQTSQSSAEGAYRYHLPLATRTLRDAVCMHCTCMYGSYIGRASTNGSEPKCPTRTQTILVLPR